MNRAATIAQRPARPEHGPSHRSRAIETAFDVMACADHRGAYSEVLRGWTAAQIPVSRERRASVARRMI